MKRSALPVIGLAIAAIAITGVGTAHTEGEEGQWIHEGAPLAENAPVKFTGTFRRRYLNKSSVTCEAHAIVELQAGGKTGLAQDFQITPASCTFTGEWKTFCTKVVKGTSMGLPWTVHAKQQMAQNWIELTSVKLDLEFEGGLGCPKLFGVAGTLKAFPNNFTEIEDLEFNAESGSLTAYLEGIPQGTVVTTEGVLSTDPETAGTYGFE